MFRNSVVEIPCCYANIWSEFVEISSGWCSFVSGHISSLKKKVHSNDVTEIAPVGRTQNTGNVNGSLLIEAKVQVTFQ